MKVLRCGTRSEGTAMPVSVCCDRDRNDSRWVCLLSVFYLSWFRLCCFCVFCYLIRRSMWHGVVIETGWDDSVLYLFIMM